MSSTHQSIRIAAAILTNGSGKLLLVRKTETKAFMQPGGKIEVGERAELCLIRELSEELQINVCEEDMHLLGDYQAPAANETNSIVEATLFAVRCDKHIHASAEIAEAIWLDPNAQTELELAPLTRDSVLPLARQYR